MERKYEGGLQLTQRLLTLEPWNEEAHRQQMRLLAYSGRWSAALAQYEACRLALATEYSAEPLFETTQLYAEIKAGRFTRVAERHNEPPLPFSHPLAPATQPPIAQPEPGGVKRGVMTQVNWDAIPVAAPVVRGAQRA